MLEIKEIIKREPGTHDVVTVDGDVRSEADHKEPKDNPDASMTLADRVEQELEAHQQVVNHVKCLLLDAHDKSEQAKKPKLHKKTRDMLKAAAGELRTKADALIAIMLIDRTLPDDMRELAIVSTRAALRGEAIQGRLEKQRRIAMGHSAVSDFHTSSASEEPRERDWMERAANDFPDKD